MLSQLLVVALLVASTLAGGRPISAEDVQDVQVPGCDGQAAWLDMIPYTVLHPEDNYDYDNDDDDDTNDDGDDGAGDDYNGDDYDGDDYNGEDYDGDDYNGDDYDGDDYNGDDYDGDDYNGDDYDGDDYDYGNDGDVTNDDSGDDEYDYDDNNEDSDDDDDADAYDYDYDYDADADAAADAADLALKFPAPAHLLDLQVGERTVIETDYGCMSFECVSKWRGEGLLRTVHHEITETCIPVEKEPIRDGCLSFCSLPSDVGVMRASLSYYFFNAEKNKCEAFKFRGGQGNANRFFEEAECKATCGRCISESDDVGSDDVGSDDVGSDDVGSDDVGSDTGSDDGSDDVSEKKTGDKDVDCIDIWPEHCAARIEKNPVECYGENIAKGCCKSCRAKKTGGEGCEYGDKASWCSKYKASDCGVIPGVEKNCCELCASGK